MSPPETVCECWRLVRASALPPGFGLRVELVEPDAIEGTPLKSELDRLLRSLFRDESTTVGMARVLGPGDAVCWLPLLKMEMRIIDDRGLIDLLFGLFCCELRYSAMSETDETVFGPSKPALIPSDAGALLLRGLQVTSAWICEGERRKAHSTRNMDLPNWLLKLVMVYRVVMFWLKP
jgi:hypothetical protein